MSIIDFDDAKRKKELPDRPAHTHGRELTILDVYMAWIQTMEQPQWLTEPLVHYTVSFGDLITEIPKNQTWVQLELDLGE